MAEVQSLEPDASGALEAHAKLALEWSALLEALAERTASSPGHASLLSLQPATTPSEAHARSARVRSALKLSEQGAELPRASFPDIRDTLGRIRLKAQVTGAELVDVRKVLEQSSALRDLVQAHAEFQPELAAWLSSDAKLNYLARSLAEALERDGSVSDAASPSLVAARQRVRETREELKRRLNDLSQRYADVLSGAYYTERDGRYVLPVRSDAHYKVEGIVLGSSGSGSTLFVEPSELITLGNRLRVREAEVERETARILGELAAQIAERLESVNRAFEVCVQADVIAALTHFALDTRAHAFDVGTEPRFDLRAMRHPMLALNAETVVPNDVQLQAGQALVVSGPNAGGKTVVLKCLGLFAWMARAGVPIPAAPNSYVGWFDYVLADVGDEQSIVRSLSTFSAHVQHLANILSCARRHVLVLLDEVAAGTDPEEGAALAAAVLETLSARGAAVAVTTHYERLKELAAEPGPLENASVGFDFTRMTPTFRLTQGIPGASSALQVAARHGLPQTLLARAAELLPQVAHERERLVLELSEEKARLETERSEFEQERTREQHARAAREEEARVAAQRERAEFERDARQLQKEVQQARAELLRVRERMKAERVALPELKSIEQQVNQIAAGVALGGRLAPRAPSAVVAAPVVAPELTPGSRVRLRATGAIATVVEAPQRGEVLVRVGAVRLRQKLSDLQVAPPAAKERAAPKARSLNQSATRPAAQRTGANTLDLRGVRVEDAALMLDSFVDRLIGAGETAGFVLHGHGTGALRTAVREHLRLSSYVEQSKPADPEDGGDALTVFWLR